jgi:hypothetical protein
MELEALKYPIGQAPSIKEPSRIELEEWIGVIEKFPSLISELTKGITKEQLSLQYRPGGWSIKQVIHHCADSHMNSFIRFKLALTEELPSIRPYFEDRWAELFDGTSDEIDDSLLLLQGLHSRWGKLLRKLTSEELQMEFKHPEHGTRFTLAENIGVYAWHSQHHLEHIKLALVAH